LIVMLDTNSRFQLGANLSSVLHNPSKTLVIDHHEPNPEIESIAEHVIVDHTTSSTCEMMVSIFDDVGIELDDTTANLLLTGMIFDTRRFFYANRKSLETTLRLLEAGADYERCVNALIIIADRSERIARLKAAGRLQIHQVDEWVIATSKIGAYEASACRGIIELGADVAIIGGKTSQGDVRISSRSTRRFSTNTGVNLGTDVMEPLGELIGGEGGGHANAAGANGVRKRDEALKKSVDLIRKAISRNLEEGRNPKVSEG
ncbi:MAG: bifunctional oligoribonuclease/PAP phosphatase NrnA, partial [Candidatus Hodarchaeota archaeon]